MRGNSSEGMPTPLSDTMIAIWPSSRDSTRTRASPPGVREVVVSGRTLTGDYLVIALGAELAAETIPGLGDAGHNFYTLAGAEALRDALAAFTGGQLVVLTAAPAYKCPAAPYEAAMLLEHACRKRGIRDRTQVDLYAAEPGPMGVAGPEVSKAVRQMVESKGIAYHPGHQVTAVDNGGRRLTFANGAEASFDLLAYVPPHRAPKVVRESGLVGESGWMSVDRHTLATQYESVYAIGDVVAIPLKLGKPLPKAGVFAHAEADVVARNIVRRITGAGEPARFDGHGACFIETGDGRAGIGKGNFNFIIRFIWRKCAVNFFCVRKRISISIGLIFTSLCYNV